MELSIGGRLPQSVDWDFYALCTELAIVDQYDFGIFLGKNVHFPWMFSL